MQATNVPEEGQARHLLGKAGNVPMGVCAGQGVFAPGMQHGHGLCLVLVVCCSGTLARAKKARIVPMFLSYDVFIHPSVKRQATLVERALPPPPVSTHRLGSRWWFLPALFSLVLTPASPCGLMEVLGRSLSNFIRKNNENLPLVRNNEAPDRV